VGRGRVSLLADLDAWHSKLSRGKHTISSQRVTDISSCSAVPGVMLQVPSSCHAVSISTQPLICSPGCKQTVS
jgi:hypothetical protein